MNRVAIVYSAHDLESKHTGVAGNQPENRKRLVQTALKTIFTKDQFIQVKEPETNFELAKLVHDDGFLDFLENGWQRWCEEYAQVPNDHLWVYGLHDKISEEEKTGKPGSVVPPFVPAYAAPRHDGLQKPSRGILGQACFYGLDRETPLVSATSSSLKWDMAVIRKAVDTLLHGSTTATTGTQGAEPPAPTIPRIVYAQITHPGHHASRSAYGGFCFINQAAIAVRLLQTSGRFQRVAVIDVDYHHGNGTMSIFWNDPTVFFASLHGDPHQDYPFNCGFPDQTGGDDAPNTVLNVPLPGGTTWKTYQAALIQVIQRVKQFDAQALVVSMGWDTLVGDPVAFPRSRFNLEPAADGASMGRLLLYGGEEGAASGLMLPTVVVQEGGYALHLVPTAVASFLSAKEE